ncbi:MAG TPA: ASKHA domain-containing protein, partial [Dehalococcoidia bacterium]|nr:ASKHA domain-containing protein [Dehalococcoidia bacterium]
SNAELAAGLNATVGAGFKPAPTPRHEHTPAAETVAEISITQQDIRELQLAKGAIYAGIQVLKKELGIEDKDIAQVLLAGAFGTYVNPSSARRIGLIPPLPPDRVKAIGNSAGYGAQLALMSAAERKIAGLIARQAEHVRLSGRADFQHYFIQALGFPPPP